MQLLRSFNKQNTFLFIEKNIFPSIQIKKIIILPILVNTSSPKY